MGVDLTSQINFKGSHRPDNAIAGDAYIDITEDMLYVFDGGQWQPIETSSIEESHAIKKTRCSTCGAILPVKNVDSNGLCECKYCRNIEYVWE